MSALTDFIVDSYSMTELDTEQLSDMLLGQRAKEWSLAIQQELARYGCTQTAQGPVGADALELFAMSERDAQSITNTYNRELANQVKSLYRKNPKGNKAYYAANLASWTQARDAWKQRQIALQTASSTRQLAQQRFRAENSVGGKFVFAGPPPVCIKCIRLRAMGAVTIEIVNQYGNSQHINCPHEWVAIRVKGQVDCTRVWAGA